MFAIKRGDFDGVIDVKRHGIAKLSLFSRQVSDYCSILESKINVAKLKDEIVDWIRIDDLQNDPVGIERIRTLPANEMDGIFFEVGSGDVLVARLGPTILNQKIVMVNDIHRRTLASSEFLVLRCKNKEMANEVMCVLRTEYFKRIMYAHSRGSTPSRYRLNREDMLALPFPKLNYATKKSAAEMLYVLNHRASKLREANELLHGVDSFVLERLGIGEISVKSRTAVAVTLKTVKTDNTMGAQYYHPERLAIIHALENDPGISTRRLDDIAGFVRNTVSADEKPYLGLAGVVSNTGELSGVEEEATGTAFEYQAGDVLYARLRPYLNKVLLAETSGVCSTEFHVMRIKNAAVLPEYLAAIMRSKVIVDQTKHMMTGNTHPRISNDDVRNLRIPIPPMNVQKSISSEIFRRTNQARLLKHEAETDWAAAKARFEKEIL